VLKHTSILFFQGTMNIQFQRSYFSLIIIPVLIHGYSLKVVLFDICLLILVFMILNSVI